MLTRGRTWLIALAAFVAAGAIAIDALGAGSPATAGWDATLSYVTAKDPTFTRVSKLHLRVTYRGAVVYNRAVPLPPDCVADGCFLRGGSNGRAFQLIDLGASNGPAALIWFWTGGVHCCTIVRAVSIPDGATAAKNFGNSSVRLTAFGGIRLFVTADDRFNYMFTSYAASGVPLQILRFRNGRFSNVTRHYPERIATDAARWWKLTRQETRARRDARGVFAAWAADTCALGQAATVRRELAARVARGVFSGESGGLAGAQYAATLLRKLKGWGYCS